MLCLSSGVVRLFESSKNHVGSDSFIISESENQPPVLIPWKKPNQRTIDPDHFFCLNLKNRRFSIKELTSNWWFCERLFEFFPKALRTGLNFWEQWLWILRTSLITLGGSVAVFYTHPTLMFPTFFVQAIQKYLLKYCLLLVFLLCHWNEEMKSCQTL